jgi:hypothetical protein
MSRHYNPECVKDFEKPLPQKPGDVSARRFAKELMPLLRTRADESVASILAGIRVSDVDEKYLVVNFQMHPVEVAAIRKAREQVAAEFSRLVGR